MIGTHYRTGYRLNKYDPLCVYMYSDRRHGDIQAEWKREENSWLRLTVNSDKLAGCWLSTHSGLRSASLTVLTTNFSWRRGLSEAGLSRSTMPTHMHMHGDMLVTTQQPSYSSNSHQGWVEAAVACIKTWGHIREACVSREDHATTVLVPPRSSHFLIPLGTPPVASLPLVWGGELGQLWSPVAPYVQRLVQAQVRLPSQGQMVERRRKRKWKGQKVNASTAVLSISNFLMA